MKRIPIPWSHRWRRFRYSVLPGTFFVFTLALTVWLWQRQHVMPSTLGEVEGQRMDVAAMTDGVLVSLPRGGWTLFETVEAHQIIARLDDSQLKADLEVLQKELAEMQGELEAAETKEPAEEADRLQSYQKDYQQISWQVEKNRLDVLDREVLLNFDEIELKRRQTRMEYLESMHEKAMVTDADYEEDKIVCEQIKKKLADGQEALKLARKQLQLSQDRLNDFPPYRKVDVAPVLKPLRAAVEAQEARIKQLQVQMEHLDIRAPISGTICAIYRWPDQTIRAGDPIMAIASGDGQYVVSYLRQEQMVRTRPGSEVLLKRHEPRAASVSSKVEHMGSQMELIPLHQLRNPQFPEWGVPVRIALPKDFPARPGELIDINFTP